VVDTRGDIKDGIRGVQPTHNGIKGVLTSVYKEGGARGLYRGAGMYVAAYRIYLDSRNWLLWWRILLENIIVEIMLSYNIY